jgi:hypothetical protein
MVCHSLQFYDCGGAGTAVGGGGDADRLSVDLHGDVYFYRLYIHYISGGQKGGESDRGEEEQMRY